MLRSRFQIVKSFSLNDVTFPVPFSFSSSFFFFFPSFLPLEEEEKRGKSEKHFFYLPDGGDDESGTELDLRETSECSA